MCISNMPKLKADKLLVKIVNRTMMLITQIMQLRKQKHPPAIITDATALAVTQNASNPAIILKHGSKGSSEQDQDAAEITTDTAVAIGSEKTNPPRRVEQTEKCEERIER